MRYMSKSEFMRLKEIPADADAETIDRYARAFWYPPYECAYVSTGKGRAEVVPAIAKTEFSKVAHSDSLQDLIDVARQYNQKSN